MTKKANHPALPSPLAGSFHRASDATQALFTAARLRLGGAVNSGLFGGASNPDATSMIR